MKIHLADNPTANKLTGSDPVNDVETGFDGEWTIGGDGSKPENGFLERGYLIHRLEEAGRTLLALPEGGYSTKLRSGSLDIVRSALESYGWGEKRVRPAIPPAAQITRMDDALSWILLIPKERYVLRRVVGARALVHPVSGRYLFSWRRLGSVLGADHKAVQRWHALGIDMIISTINQKRARSV